MQNINFKQFQNYDLNLSKMYMYQCINKNAIFQKQIISKILQPKNYLVTSTIKYIDVSPNIETETTNLKSQKTHLNINELIDKYKTSILYNSVIEDEKLKIGFRKNKANEKKLRKEYQQHLLKLQSSQPLPVSLKYLNEIKPTEDKFADTEETEANITQFPFESYEKIVKSDQGKHVSSEEFNTPKNEVIERYSQYDPTKNWMSDYENYDDLDTGNDVKYGTPDPKSTVSNVPCGGCGSLLHCKDTSIPGYIPSEIFKSHQKQAGQYLRSIICQRCHFLQHYNMALQVRVSPTDYPIILRTINANKNALVILMVDLLDFPCSIWPNIIDIIGRERPVIIVGNKIDLLPQDSRGYLGRIQDILVDNIEQFGLSKANIQHVALISAKTGYGIEELITKLHNIWKYEGDVYLVGCTNVGKSTLFNALLQSDYCKTKAADLVQRATTSIWPGTTLNLLKFPILRPSGWRLFVRTKRLISLNKIKNQENRIRKMQLQKTNNPKYATLMGHMEQTFPANEPVDEEDKDMFTVQGHGNASGKNKIGINEKEPQFRMSKWCYDTPGVVQPDQILHLLTTEELMLTLPKQLIQPRTYSVKSGSTIFIAGLGRLDFIKGPESIRVTVFASETLPVTICAIETAERIYNDLLGTELFKVPIGDKDRLNKWPQLVAGDEIKLNGVAWTTACADIVLSSAGWISVTLGPEMQCNLQPWTPEKRGIFVRDSILAKAVTLRGRRIRFSPAYRKSQFYNE